MLDFPSPATNGQLFSAGGMTWRFDGTKWTETTGALSLPDAPQDGHTYGRNNAAWTSVDAQLAPTAQMATDNVGRNLIHNPVYTVQQRGTGPWTTNANYTADRWLMFMTNDTLSVSVVSLADADRTAIGDESAQFGFQAAFTGSATAGSFSVIQQKSENVRRFSGKALTLSFWARATSGTPRLGVNLNEQFGTGGSPSANAPTSFGATAALTTAWTRYTMAATLPSAAGKTFGTTVGTDFVATNIWLSDQGNQSGAGIGVQSGTVQIWGVQLEYGSVATPLDKGGSPQQQLAECQRFYQTSTFYASGWNGATFPFYVSYLLPVTLRATPTLAMSGLTYTNASGGSIAPLASGGFMVQANITTAGSIGAVQGTYTASADL